MDKFNTSLAGYKKEEVNKFVNDVVKQVETMLTDLRSKDAEIARIKHDLEYYKNMENTFNRAILVAEDASNQIKRVARDESATIVEEAKRNASRIVNDALFQAEKTQKETEQLKRNIITFKRRLRMIIESQLDLVDDIDHLDV